MQTKNNLDAKMLAKNKKLQIYKKIAQVFKILPLLVLCSFLLIYLAYERLQVLNFRVIAKNLQNVAIELY